ncbi:nitrogen fixation protein NifZ [Thalassolituus sp.]|jgi:nitrogen fixation protein NifZ|uniref:nitrogen fixation protein NifZ n=1 Tax=Thalassolituus sp. TaxID=2030822 RepID=UPI002A8219A2|nr:nitrogen fixation protein NifZ [Thalassolituus sp.]|tara:strand:- start:4480 stop:4737 length:258 start_codon:yes stop_codon:yes gene_type:complete
MTKLEKGDAVYATTTIRNDGSVPGFELDAILAEPGSMGMLVNTGHLEENPAQEMLLVCFNLSDGSVGPLVTCFPDEISPERIPVQ